MGEYLSLNDKQKVLEIYRSSEPKVIYFHMKDCPYCIKTNKPWSELKTPGYKKYKVEVSAIPDELGIEGFPQFSIREKTGELRIVKGSQESVQKLKKALELKLNGGTRRFQRRFTRRLRGRTRKSRY
jgi:hypothetical protein